MKRSYVYECGYASLAYQVLLQAYKDMNCDLQVKRFQVAKKDAAEFLKGKSDMYMICKQLVDIKANTINT